MRIVFCALVFMNLNPMERKDYEKSAKQKSERYAGFVQIMNMLENSENCISELAERRQFTQLNVNTTLVVEQDDLFEYSMISIDDYKDYDPNIHF